MKRKILLLCMLVAALWVIEFADIISNHRLDHLGAIHPRSLAGLAQIFTAPFLHGSIPHLISNTSALIPLGALMLLEGSFWPVTLIAMVVGGLGTWLFSGASALGFSGVLFGYCGYLLARGFYTRKPLATGLSLLAMSWFGSAVFMGLVPHQGISWAGHFWGLMAGLFCARTLGRR